MSLRARARAQRQPTLDLGTVRGVEVRSNRGSQVDRVLLLVELWDSENVQTCELAQAGRKSHPRDGDRVYVIDAGRAYKLAVLVRDAVELSLNSGEEASYSRDGNGDIAASVIWRADGTIEFNGTGRTLVTFAELDSALQSFRQSIDSAIASAISGHTHGGVTSGDKTTAPGSGSADSTSVDISDAEAENLRTE